MKKSKLTQRNKSKLVKGMARKQIPVASLLRNRVMETKKEKILNKLSLKEAKEEVD